VADEIPHLLPQNSSHANAQALREIYDKIYRHHTDVWIDQGRSNDFQAYVSTIIGTFDHTKILEVGCGEGILLAAMPGQFKFGIDPSPEALSRARRLGNAKCSVAQCEYLPFPTETFDSVVAIGVMEHFTSIDRSLSEIYRVLKPNGIYIALIHTDMTRRQRFVSKVKQYLFPRFRPLSFARWILKWGRKRLMHPIIQPNRRSYSVAAIQHHFDRNHLHTLRIVSSETEPSAPLAGPHVVILIAQKT
jgi:ubiquinone/menaquinone biosynthesis C-methylase UbiE